MPTDTSYIKSISCFQDLTPEQVDALAEISDIVCYPPKHNIFEEGVLGKRLYFLLKGKVEILFNTGKPDLTRIDIKEAEYVMGCSALMEPYMYAATNRSLTEVEVLEVNIPKLVELMEKDCKLGMAIQKQLIQFLKEYIMKLRSMVAK